MQVDGYAGYRGLADRGDVRLAFCSLHVRRYFYSLSRSVGHRQRSTRTYRRGLCCRERHRGRDADERRTVSNREAVR
ncbi:transposase [Bradyrhizobium sp. CCGB12]|uniref:IS66 family transposase n=1 Tax=Bradyrhizobium sp. CCGB12 TaxID=2949632 RepID=UPI0035BF6A25